MGQIYQSVEELIGRTPLLEVTKIERLESLAARVLVKLECFNPSGSVKDRAALSMILDAEERGALLPGGTIIEPTSGNTGIGIASIAASRGYKAVLVMPETMSVERQKLLLGYGAKLVLTEGKLGMKGAIAKAEELAEAKDNAVILGQFTNEANPQAHVRTTGPEIWEDTKGEVDIFVAGAGTGGTVTGIGRFLKEKKSTVKITAVEPAGSPVISGGTPGAHGLQGIGAGFVPEILDRLLLDEIMLVTDEEALQASRLLALREGVLTGISSGAALHAAMELAKREENAGKTIVALLPDTGERYLSTVLFS